MSRTLKDGRKRSWWWVENELFDDGHVARMGLAAYAVYTALIRYADENGVAFPSLKRIEEVTGLSRQGVINSIRKLREFGYLDLVKQGGANKGNNVYEIIDLSEVLLEVVNSVDQGSQPSRPEVVNSVDQGSQLSGPEVVNSVDPKNTYIRKPIEKEIAPQKEFSELPAYEKRWYTGAQQLSEGAPWLKNGKPIWEYVCFIGKTKPRHPDDLRPDYTYGEIEYNNLSHESRKAYWLAYQQTLQIQEQKQSQPQQLTQYALSDADIAALRAQSLTKPQQESINDEF